MCSWDFKFQRQIRQFKRLHNSRLQEIDNNEQPASKVELKIFTRLVFKLKAY